LFRFSGRKEINAEDGELKSRSRSHCRPRTTSHESIFSAHAGVG